MNVVARKALSVILVFGVFVAGLYVVGRLNPAPTPPVTGDVLGPDSGELVAAYLARAGESLSGSDDDRWALVSLVAPSSSAAVWSLIEQTPTLLSQSIFNVPIDRVQTPTAIVPSGNTEGSFVASSQVAAEVVVRRSTGTDRANAVGQVASQRLRQGCDCVVGVVIRARLDRLRALADAPEVRAVQALPGDASAGLFAVVPLLPGMTTVVGPTPDDGPIPAV